MASRRGPDNSVRVAISGNLNGVNWANVFACQLTAATAPTQAMLDTWTDAFAAAYKTAFAGTLPPVTNFINAKAVMFLPGGAVLESSRPMTGSGTGGTAVQDDAISAVVSWTTSVYWRGGKPRTYLPGLAQSQVTNNNSLVGGFITTLTTAGNSFRTAVNALTATNITATVLGFFSFRTGNAERPAGLFFPIGGAIVHPRLGTQRRRLGRWVQ